MEKHLSSSRVQIIPDSYGTLLRGVGWLGKITRTLNIQSLTETYDHRLLNVGEDVCSANKNVNGDPALDRDR